MCPGQVPLLLRLQIRTSVCCVCSMMVRIPCACMHSPIHSRVADIVTAHNASASRSGIFSYVVNGHLIHQDSEGHKETLGRGAVQYMSAGTGVWHSEMNEGDETYRFLQVYLLASQATSATVAHAYRWHRYGSLRREGACLCSMARAPSRRNRGRTDCCK
jgi:hypothetical protein